VPAAVALLMSAGLDAGVWRAVFAFILFLVVVLVPGLWGVHKTTGRPYREMLLLLTAALVLIGLMVPAVVFFDGAVNSPDPGTRNLAKVVFRWGFLAIAMLVWWCFNRLARVRRRRRDGSHKEAGVVNPDQPDPPRCVGN
jgi:hypothetical protein